MDGSLVISMFQELTETGYPQPQPSVIGEHIFRPKIYNHCESWVSVTVLMTHDREQNMLCTLMRLISASPYKFGTVAMDRVDTLHVSQDQNVA